MQTVRNWALLLLILALCLRATIAQDLPFEDRNDPYIGMLEPGHVYRKVNDKPITGKDLLELIIDQSYDEQLKSFAEQMLSQEALKAADIEVGASEVQEELLKLAKLYLKDPKVAPAAPEEVVRQMVSFMPTLKTQTEIMVGFKKLLVREGKIKADASMESDEFFQAKNAKMDKLMREWGVQADPKMLGESVVLKLGGQTFSRQQYRAFLLESQGAIRKHALKELLDFYTLEMLVADARKAQGHAEADPREALFHISYLARIIEAEKVVPGGGRSILEAQLKQKGSDLVHFMADRRFKLDAGVTWLAHAEVTDDDMRAEWKAQPERYERIEKSFAHLFIRVCDRQGHPWTPNWEIQDHPKIQDFVAQEREECFKEAKVKIDALEAPARADFEGTVKAKSDDAGTKDRGGKFFQRLGLHSAIPDDLPLDRTALAEALKLKPGEISGPIRSDYGWHILKCLDDVRELKDEERYRAARERIFVTLLKHRREECWQRLLKNAKIEDNF